MRHVRDARQNVAQPRIQVSRSFFQRLNLFPQFLGLSDGRRSILPGLFQLGNILRGLVPPRLHGLGFRNRLPPLRVHVAEILKHGSRVGSALAQHFFHPRQIVTNKIQLEHRD
jgi:hypothetical protein